MKLKYKLLMILIAFVGLSGCQSGLGVTYNSAPQSAKVVCNGQFKGYTPVTLWYNINTSDLQRGFVSTQHCQAIWMGGAVENYRNQFPVQSNSHWYKINAMSRNVTNVDIQFDNQRMQAFQAQQAETNRMIQSMNQPKSVSTYCNKIGTMTSCSSYAY